MTCGFTPPESFTDPDDRGDPRVQYERTYILLPPNADVGIAEIVVEETWDRRRFTIGGSADDAGIGDLDTRKVLALNPQEWPGDLKAFFETYYPGVSYASLEYETETELREGLREYMGLTPSHPHYAFIGINDPTNQGAGEWMKSNKIKSFLYIPWALDYGPTVFDFTPLENAGISVFVNLRFSWASADGGQGTLPLLVNQQRFADACVDTISRSTGVYAWSLTNEANSPREWPKKADGSLETISPARLAAFFAYVQARAPHELLSIGGFDPFNVESGLDPREWTTFVWEQLGIYQPSFIDVHGYIRGPDANLVGSDGKFPAGKLSWQYLNFPKCYETLLEAMPDWAQSLPVIVSEFNHLWKTVEPDWGWVNDERASDVIVAAKDWLQAQSPYANRTLGFCVYRWQGDAWETYNNSYVKATIKESYNG